MPKFLPLPAMGRLTDGVSAADHQRLGVFLDGLRGDPDTLMQHVRLTREVVHRVTVPGTRRYSCQAPDYTRRKYVTQCKAEKRTEILFGRQQVLQIQG